MAVISISMPIAPAFKSSNWGIKRAVAISESPFTGSANAQEYGMARWYATLSLPPMKREQAVEWQAFFLKLHGRNNIFLLGDPDAKVFLGTTTTATTSSVGLVGATTINMTLSGSDKTIEVGDYIQFGTATAARLHMVTTQRTGNGAVAFEPALKSQVSSGVSVGLTGSKGVFRMDSNELTWSSNEISTYGVTFSCSEVV
tara:strand:+ start:187 stop:786 length:600 start_codon:yes stop_codon:yes gene_type:complete